MNGIGGPPPVPFGMLDGAMSVPNGDYILAGKFGKRITLPEPFGLELDTGEFPEN